MDDSVRIRLSESLGREAQLSSADMKWGGLDHLLQCLSEPPSLTTVRINTLKHTRDSVIKSLTQIMAKKYLQISLPPPPVLPHHSLPDVVVIPNTGPRADVVPQGRSVVVGLQCGLAVMRGADVFAPGVMGAPKDMQRGECVSVFADLVGRCKKGLTVEFEGKKVFVGNGTAVLSRQELFKESGISASGVAVQMSDPLYVAPSLNSELQDAIFLQNLPSIVTVYVLDPQPGDTVLDMCAAPGGKSTHIGVMMQNEGCLVAVDKTPPKVAKLRQNVQRFGLSCIHCFTHDSTTIVRDSAAHLDPQSPHPPPYPPGSFDRVLLDAPCSALGQRPQLMCGLNLKDLDSYPHYQRKLIKQAVAVLRPGGTLVYSTCTYNPEENERQVDWVMKTFPQMHLAEQAPFLGYPGLPGQGLPPELLKRVQRFWPFRFVKQNSLYEPASTATVCDEVTASCDDITEHCGRDGAIQGCSEPEPQSVTLDTTQDQLRDTIGFFIAKFKKAEANI